MTENYLGKNFEENEESIREKWSITVVLTIRKCVFKVTIKL